MNIPKELSNRHSSTLGIFQFFAYTHLEEPLRSICKYNYDLALNMVMTMPDGLELTAGLRKLLEARDCFMRNALVMGVNKYNGSDEQT